MGVENVCYWYTKHECGREGMMLYFCLIWYMFLSWFWQSYKHTIKLMALPTPLIWSKLYIKHIMFLIWLKGNPKSKGIKAYSFLPNTRAPLNNSAPLGVFENLIIVPGEIRKMPVESHLLFWVLLPTFGELFSGLVHKILIFNIIKKSK